MINIQNQSISTSDITIVSEKSPVSQEQLQHEVDYVRAQQVLTSMLEKGLISLSEFNKITDLNRKTSGGGRHSERCR